MTFALFLIYFALSAYFKVFTDSSKNLAPGLGQKISQVRKYLGRRPPGSNSTDHVSFWITTQGILNFDIWNHINFLLDQWKLQLILLMWLQLGLNITVPFRHNLIKSLFYLIIFNLSSGRIVFSVFFLDQKSEISISKIFVF